MTTELKAVNIPTIASSAMLAELNISIWTARKKDKKASLDVAAANHADSGAANVTKHLLGKSAELDAIQKFATRARGVHYNMTMPWSDSGLRLLPTAHFFEYQKTMTGLQAEFDGLVEKFLRSYQWAIGAAHAKLGGLFRADEYPSEKSVARMFGFKLNYLPLAEAGDFRIDINAEAQEQLHAQYTEHATSMYQKAMDDLWERLYDNLTALARSLTAPDNEYMMVKDKGTGLMVQKLTPARRIYDSVFDKVVSLISMLDSCNIACDPRMDQMKRELEQALRGVSTDALKHSPSLRDETHEKLQAAIAALPSLDM